MAERDVKIVISAKDDTSGAFKSLEKSAKNFSERMKGVGVASLASLAGIGAFAKKAVDEANAQIRVNAQLEQVLKSTGSAAGLTSKEVLDMANSLQAVTTVGGDVIGAGQNMLLTFTNIGRDVFPQATETLLDMATAMNGGATPSAEQLSSQAIQLGKALNDPTQGITALTRVGVTFTEEQKKQIETMTEAGNVMGAQKIILAELGREFGGQARAQAQTFEGQMAQLNNTLGDAKVSIGMALAPVLTELMKSITPIITATAKWIQENPELSKTILLVAAGAAALGASFLVLSPIIAGIIVAIKATSVALLFLAANPIGLVIAGLALLAGALYAVYKNWDAIRPQLLALWTTIGGTINYAVETTRDTVVGAFEFMSAKVTAITDYIGGKVRQAMDFANSIRNALKDVGGNLYESAAGAVSNIAGARADGGPVSAGRTYLVGERGPELFTPSSSGQIIPNGGG
jgi:hypothetical protein